MKRVLVLAMIVLSLSAHFAAIYRIQGGFPQPLNGVGWVIAVEPWLSLITSIGLVFAIITIGQSQLVVGSLCFPFFVGFSISFSVWPPHATPLWLIQVVLAIVDSLGVRIDDQRQPVSWALLHLLDCVLLSLVPLLVSWMFAGWMKKILRNCGQLLKTFCAVVTSFVGLWLYFLP